MFGRIVSTALLAGVMAGVVVWGAHMVKTTPLILAAEVYETAPAAHSHADTQAHAHPAPAQAQDQPAPPEAQEWAPADGIERNLYTLLADVVTGVGFAFLLVGAMALSGRRVDARRGVVWGLAGFATVYLAPAFGLAPELPGMQAAGLDARQAWWLLTALATAAGLGLIAFLPARAWKAAGLGLIVLPHLIGAPRHALQPGAVPAELAAEFAVATLVIGGLFWVVLGGLAGYFYRRFEHT